jgi:O-antigen/teichoic acid export membrane protein
MIRLRQLVTGVAMNWLAVLVGILSSFFLSPFVVRSLGATGYGVWVLATSTVIYLGLLDLGLRGAVTHFIARHHAQGDHELASRSFSTVFQIRALISVVVIAVAILLAVYITCFLLIPADYPAAARWTVVTVGLSTAATLTCGMYGAILAGLNRFDLLSSVTIVQTIVNAAGTVWLLRSGYGVTALSVWQASSLIAGGLAQVWYGQRLYPQLRLRFERPDMALLRQVWSFSFYALLINVSGYVIYLSGNLITGAFISTAAVTTYTIAVRLVEYHKQVAGALTQVFMPLTSGLNAINDAANIRRVLVHGTRVSLLVSWPIQAVLFLRGGTFISLWMGAEYGATSGYLLQILILSNLLAAGNGVSGSIAFGVGKHKPFALWQCAEAVVNVLLTLWLVKGRALGVAGVAWGVTLPGLMTQGLLWPIYITRLVQYPVSRYLREAWFRPALAVLPFAAGCVWAEHYLSTPGLTIFFLQLGATLVLYAIGLLIVFRKEVVQQWQTPDSVLQRRVIQPLTRRAGMQSE